MTLQHRDERDGDRRDPSVLYLHADPDTTGEATQGVVDHGAGGTAREPGYFADLNLDQVRDALFAGFEDYHLEGVFCALLDDPAGVEFRQEVFSDLEHGSLLDAIERFSKVMVRVRSGLAHADNLDQEHQRARWHLDMASAYADAVRDLRAAFDATEPGSPALRAIGAYLRQYVESPTFASLRDECRAVLELLDAIRYTVQVRGLRVSVLPYGGDADYSADVARTFERFRQGAVKDYRLQLRDWKVLDRVEAQILDRVARLFPDQFGALHAFSHRWSGFLDPVVRRFDREVQFYVAYLRWSAPMRAAGLPWCHPEIHVDAPTTSASGAYDAALAQKLVSEGRTVVTNDFELAGPERVLVVTGPNQGGKTTFARAFGQLHHLAALGCPIPAAHATLRLCDTIFTHFEREEDLAVTGGKLEDDLVRLRQILLDATPRSVIVLNEIFTSTTLDDALYLGGKVLERVEALDCICVYVTFAEPLASRSDATVSMVSEVDPADPTVRTFKVVRRPADGRSYALAIAEQHGLTYEQLHDQIGRRATPRVREIAGPVRQAG